YIFDYNKGNLTTNTISNLTKWSSDLDILQVFRQSCHFACELAEYLNMLMPDSLLINILQPIVLIELINDLEVSFSPTNIETDEIDSDMAEFSKAVRKASSEVSDFLNFEQNLDEETDINEYQIQADLVNQSVSITSLI
ncbi:17817_t:CDS:1, partial [Funneliformis geosporum]